MKISKSFLIFVGGLIIVGGALKFVWGIPTQRDFGHVDTTIDRDLLFVPRQAFDSQPRLYATGLNEIWRYDHQKNTIEPAPKKFFVTPSRGNGR